MSVRRVRSHRRLDGLIQLYDLATQLTRQPKDKSVSPSPPASFPAALFCREDIGDEPRRAHQHRLDGPITSMSHTALSTAPCCRCLAPFPEALLSSRTWLVSNDEAISGTVGNSSLRRYRRCHGRNLLLSVGRSTASQPSCDRRRTEGILQSEKYRFLSTGSRPTMRHEPANPSRP